MILDDLTSQETYICRYHSYIILARYLQKAECSLALILNPARNRVSYWILDLFFFWVYLIWWYCTGVLNMIGGMNCQIYTYTYTYVCLYLHYTFTYTCTYRHGSNGSKSVKLKLSSPSHQQYTACTMVKHGDYGLWSSPNNWAILNTSHSDTIGEILNSQVICATLQSPSH